MRKALAVIGIVLGTVAPAAAVEIQDSVFEAQFPYAGVDRAIETTDIPYLPGDACYAWYLRTADTAGLTIAERLILPVALADWGNEAEDDSDDIEILEDGKVAVRTFTPDLDADGWFTDSWCVVDGDPLGDYRIEVTAGTDTLAAYDFRVILPEDFAWPAVTQPDPAARSADTGW